MELLIHIYWDGPFSLDKVAKLNNPERDFGIYQVYAQHPVYGRCLTYIGRARNQTFATRLLQSRWNVGSENDPSKLEFYVGRLRGAESPGVTDQYRHIELAEALLIHSHGPAYNTQYIKEPPSSATHGHVRVLNWGSVRSLHREVSGLMWTAASTEFANHRSYERPPVFPPDTAEDAE